MRKETLLKEPAPADRKLSEALAEHEAERQAYLLTLDPRQRRDLDPPQKKVEK